jgi:hypothetical protein
MEVTCEDVCVVLQCASQDEYSELSTETTTISEFENTVANWIKNVRNVTDVKIMNWSSNF